MSEPMPFSEAKCRYSGENVMVPHDGKKTFERGLIYGYWSALILIIIELVLQDIPTYSWWWTVVWGALWVVGAAYIGERVKRRYE